MNEKEETLQSLERLAGQLEEKERLEKERESAQEEERLLQEKIKKAKAKFAQEENQAKETREKKGASLRQRTLRSAYRAIEAKVPPFPLENIKENPDLSAFLISLTPTPETIDDIETLAKEGKSESGVPSLVSLLVMGASCTGFALLYNRPEFLFLFLEVPLAVLGLLSLVFFIGSLRRFLSRKRISPSLKQSLRNMEEESENEQNL